MFVLTLNSKVLEAVHMWTSATGLYTGSSKCPNYMGEANCLGLPCGIASHGIVCTPRKGQHAGFCPHSGVLTYIEEYKVVGRKSSQALKHGITSGGRFQLWMVLLATHTKIHTATFFYIFIPALSLFDVHGLPLSSPGRQVRQRENWHPSNLVCVFLG